MKKKFLFKLKVYVKIYILVTALFLVGCGTDGFVEIDSLNHPGSNFFQGQNVPMWVSVKVSDLKNASYEWQCSGGEFQFNPGAVNSLSHTVWKAPKKNGQYSITCTVSCDGVQQSRTTTVTVNNYFFVGFEIINDNEYFKAADYPLTNGFLTNVKNGEAELIGSRSNILGQFSMANNIDSVDQKKGFTFNVDIAWRNNYKSAISPFVWRYFFYKPKNIDGTAPKEYIRELQLLLYPTSTTSTSGFSNVFGIRLPTATNYVLVYEVYNPAFSSSVWHSIALGRNDVFSITDGAIEGSVNKGFRNFELKIDANNVLYFGFDKSYQLSSSKLKEWLENNPNIEQHLKLRNIMFRSFDDCNMYLDNWGLELEEVL